MVKTVCHFYFSRKERGIEGNRVFDSRIDLDSVLSRAKEKQQIKKYFSRNTPALSSIYFYLKKTTKSIVRVLPNM